MKLSDFDFDLPEDLIATRPAKPRPSARLLLAEGDAISDRRVLDLLDILRPGDRLVLNNTKVLPARLFGTRQRGDALAKVEVTLLEPRPTGWRALAKPLRKVQPGEVIRFSDRLSATVAEKSETDLVLAFDLTGADFDAALAEAGVMPLPPYIAAKRAADDQDRTDYQTVFARHSGAVAAPTASCISTKTFSGAGRHGGGVHRSHPPRRRGHLPAGEGGGCDHPQDARRMGPGHGGCGGGDQRDEAGRGPGDPGRHHRAAADRKCGGRSGHAPPWEGETAIFIYPGYRFRVTDALMTNFHLPKSTLVMLVAALMGEARIRRIYDHAIAEGYRFFSYGDSSLLIPEGAT
jgi:S-adenosylmethionine:tRNA ribosyltransferase-isomerase